MYTLLMATKSNAGSKNQEIFREMFVGVLLYSVVLGFFNDYTDILHTGTYSVTFSVAVVMEILTYLTFMFKDWVVSRFNSSQIESKVWLGLSIWLIMFFSKFIFLGVISVVFSDEVYISGFLGLLLIIITLTLVQKLVQVVYEKLGE